MIRIHDTQRMDIQAEIHVCYFAYCHESVSIVYIRRKNCQIVMNKR